MCGKRCPEKFKAETVKQVIDRGHAGKVPPNKKPSVFRC